jgi:hypothetical protein
VTSDHHPSASRARRPPAQEIVLLQDLRFVGVFDRINAALPRLLAPMIKEWVAAQRDEDLRISLTTLETAIEADRPYAGT